MLYAAFVAAIAAFPASSANAQEARAKIRVSYPNISICCLALFAAQQWKIF
jgi:hypothetical protein